MGGYDPSGNVSAEPESQSLMPGQGTAFTIPGINMPVKQHQAVAFSIGAYLAASGGAVTAVPFAVGTVTAIAGGIAGNKAGTWLANQLGFHAPEPGPEPTTKGDPIWHKSKGGLLAGLVTGLVVGVAVGLAVGAVVASGGLAAPLVVGAIAAGAGGLAGGLAGGGVTGFMSQTGSTVGEILTGSPNVTFEGRAAARVTDLVSCSRCGEGHQLAQGSQTISVNGLPLVRKGHKTDCDAIVEKGRETVSADMTTGTYMPIHSSEGVVLDTLTDVIGDAAMIAGGRGGRKTPEIERPAMGPERPACPRGEPVDVTTGAYTTERTDFSWPGIVPLKLTRCYLSDQARWTPLGRRWTSNWTQRLWFAAGGREVLLENSDGNGSRFYVEPGQPFDARTRIKGQYHLTGDRTAAHLFDRRRQLTYVFSPDGLSDEFNVLTAIVDRNGNQNSFIYDKGLLVRVIASDGTVFVVESTPEGWISALRRKGETRDLLSYSYDPKGYLTSTTSFSHGTLTYSYTDDGLLAGWRDSGPTQFSLVYDKERRVVATRTPEGLYNDRFVYFPDERKVQYIDATGACETIWYNKDHLQTRSENAEGHVTLYEWDDRHNKIAETDALGRVTRYSYNTHNELISREDWAGRKTAYSYTEFGRLAEVSFPDGNTLQWEYDERGNLISEMDATGAVTRCTYDARGMVTGITDPTGATTRYTYGIGGRLAAIIDPAGAETRLIRDTYGRVVRHADAQGHVTEYEYQPSPTNPREKLSRITRADGGAETFAYDQEGLLARHQRASGQDARRQYGAFDLLRSITDAAGCVTRFSYDGAARLTSVVNAAGQSWTYEYDSAGRRIAEKDFAGRVTHYQRDAVGRLLVKTKPDGEEHHVEWDARDNIAAITTPTQAIRYKYDSNDRLIRATTERDGDGETELLLFYDKAGRISREIQDGAEIDYCYDDAGRIINRKSASGAADWSYDPRGLLNEFISNNHSVGFRHNVLGLETKRETAAGFALARSYDPCGRLAAQRTGRLADAAVPASADAISRRYWWDKSGRLQGISDSIRGETSYQYDYRDQVLWMDRAEQGQEKGRARYNYDHLMNLVESEAGVHAYDHDHELKQIGGNTYLRDERGRVTLRTVVANGFRPKTWTYEWDSFDRLVATRTPDGSLWRYTYDAFGRRVRKECVTVGRESVTRFLWQGARLAEEWTATGTVRWHYEPGAFRPLAKEVALAGSGGGGSRFYPVVTDHLGTPKEVFDDRGECQWRADHELWGLAKVMWRERSVEDNEAGCQLRFQGQYEDDETGLFYNLHRYYDPVAGMYLSPDPIGLAGGVRQQGYVHQPTGWIDPLGWMPLANPTSQGHHMVPWQVATDMGIQPFNSQTGVPAMYWDQGQWTGIEHSAMHGYNGIGTDTKPLVKPSQVQAAGMSSEQWMQSLEAHYNDPALQNIRGDLNLINSDGAKGELLAENVSPSEAWEATKNWAAETNATETSKGC